MSDGDLWSFSNRFYGLSGVSEACLKLQDDHGVDVCVLMVLLWFAERRRTVRDTQIQMMLRVSAPWREQVVLPLRAVRRWLKTAPAPFDSRSAAALRATVKAAELRAERLQLEQLESLFGRGRLCVESLDVATALRMNLQAYASLLATTFCAGTVDTLVSAMSAVACDE